ncbi:MAG TPA: ABC transporter permease [Candidatus Dormibacteraeota bacterium]|jgi:ABC-type spermidine/putrescine transport system permease subunit II|nr:ABC transporter permease [Candidatus Dormibacteraeota bacterium]
MTSSGHRVLGLVLGAVAVFMLAPIAIVVVNSFNSVPYGAWPPPGYSLRWYVNLSQQTDFADAAVRSLVVGAVATALALVAGTLASLALIRFRFPGKAAINGLLLAPMIVPRVAIGMAAFTLFVRVHVYGTLWTLMIAHTALILPFAVTIISGALLRVRPELEQAAQDLGASPARAFLTVALPQLRRALVAAAVLSFVVSFDEVDASIFMVSQADPTLPVAMYNYMQKYQDPTLAALSTILVAATLLLAVLLLRSFGVSGFAEMVERPRGQPVIPGEADV